MSIEALGYVFLLRLPANEKWLLVCLANHADKWGDSIFPALETLEDETGMSRSTIKRAFKELLKRGVIERSAKSTPVSPAFYLIVGVPEPKAPAKSEPSCPNALRRAVMHEFDSRCEYCGRQGSKELGPDLKPWQIDRVIPGRKGGIYTPDNVTLACRLCNTKKKANDAPPGTRTLSDLQHQRTVQVEPSSNDTEAVEILVESRESSIQPEPSEGPFQPGGRVHADAEGEVCGNPEPLIESCIDPDPEKAGAAPQLSGFKRQNPDQNLSVITKLAHEVLDLFAETPDITHAEIVESVKRRCAVLAIAYAGDVVYRAIDSALFQRQRAGKASVISGSSGEAAFRLSSEAP